MEVDLPLAGGEVSPFAFDVEVRDPAMLGLDVGPHVLTLATHMILELAARGSERIADCDIEVLVRTVERVVAAYLDIGPGDREVHANVIALALAMVLVRTLDHHAAALDTIGGGLESRSPAANEFFDCRTRFQIPKCDRQWKWHVDRSIAR